MPAGSQEWRREVEEVGRPDLIKAATVGPPPPAPSTAPSLFHQRGNKSDRVQSLSLICQWGEWVGMRLSERPAAARPPCQPYWIMTRQEVACYEPHGGRRQISQTWVRVRGDGAGGQLKWNLSVCKVHDASYGVMGFEKILDWLWWRDELQQSFRQCYQQLIWMSPSSTNLYCLQ